ncbi:MAG: TetR/AcrR family transcriptional regulator [Actinobacteria bacterium]|nr:TetR/AcrR family transcriptional regulator [Actinomycetota bacterium]NBU16799.1 TetR/AcrR family transcriptional regulator [Actinomycetota bacterium]
MARTRITEIGEESRQRILDAAEELFLERGYEKTTLSAIGERCGISYGSIPWHFGNKAGLLYAVMARIVSQPGASPAIDGAIPLGMEGLERILEGQRFWDDHPKLELWLMLELAYPDVPPEIAAEILEVDARWHRSLEEWVRRTMDGRPLPDGVTESGVARMITSFNRGLGISRHFGGQGIDVAGSREALFHGVALMMGLNS